MVRGISGTTSQLISQYLGDCDFPADKQSLINFAKQKHADKNTIAVLESLPDQKYTGTSQIIQNIRRDV